MKKNSPLSAFLSLLLLPMLLLTFCLAVPAHAALSWSVQTVDDYGSATGNGYCPIAVDSNNTAHIAYTDWSEGTERAWPWWFVMYASWNGSGWNTQKVSNGSTYSFVLDANGNPHVLYSYYAPVSFAPKGLMYASLIGSSWISQTVDVNGAGFGMVALDSFGTPHVAYTDGTSIKYAYLKGSSWSIQTVATYEPGDIAFTLAFALDKNDVPYIMYSPSSYADYNQVVGIMAINVTLATYQNSSWKIQPLSLPTPTGDYGNLVVDSKGYLHSIFTQHHFVSSENMTTLNTLLYASWNGSFWNTQTIISNVGRFDSMSLAFDSHDYPHIFTSSGVYASWTGTTWDVHSANLNRSAYGPIYLALDSNGNPHVSYRQSTPYQVIANIVYATANETAPSPTAQPFSPTFPALPLLLASTAVIIGAIIITIYFKKRKR